jgi:hypothetical protein
MRASISVSEMLAYLILDQCITKREISRVIRASIQEINQEKLNDRQLSRIERIYWRMKNYEDHWSLYLDANESCMGSAS